MKISSLIIAVLEDVAEKIGDEYETSEFAGDESTRDFLDALHRVLDTADIEEILDASMSSVINWPPTEKGE